MAVRLALLATAAGSAGLFFLDRAAAQGLVMGGIAGVLTFWIEARRVEKVAIGGGGQVKFAPLAWTALRFALFGAVLIRAYFLDRDRMLGLLGAIAGIFVIRFVTVFLGITGLDLKRGADPKGERDGP
jgi:hypothetical protein